MYELKTISSGVVQRSCDIMCLQRIANALNLSHYGIYLDRELVYSI